MLKREEIHIAPVADTFGRFDGVEILHIPTRISFKSIGERNSNLNLRIALIGLEEKITASGYVVPDDEAHRVA